jgi:hypothetical protein
MKNISLTLTGVCVILFSCRKEESQQVSKPSVTAKKYAVKFNVSDLEQSVGAISGKRGNSVSANGDSLKYVINNLIYLAYDSAGAEVGRIRHGVNVPSFDYFTSYKNVYNSTNFTYYKEYNEPFGSLVDSLPSGKYTIVLLGSNIQRFGRYVINDRRANDPATFEAPDDRESFNTSLIAEEYGLSPDRVPQTEDTFYKKFSLTVGNQNVDQEVNLERLTGKLEVNILDKLPANATQFECKVYGAGHGIKLNTSAIVGSTNYLDEGDDYEWPESQRFHPVQIKAEERASYKYSQYLYGREQVVRVKLQCWDANNNLIVTKNIPNVHIYKNKRTILSGKLFETTAQTGFTVSVNSEWDPATVEVPF